MKKIFLALGLLFLLFPQGANAQSQRNPCFYDVASGSGCTPVSKSNPLPVTSGGGGGGGTSSAFDAAFPANGTAIGLSDGTNMKDWLAAIALGDGVNGNNTAAVAWWLWNGASFDRARGDTTNGLWVNCKTGCGSGSGAVTIADGADIALGTTTDAPATTPTSATAATTIALLKSLANSNTASIPAGTNNIGSVNQGTSPWIISGTVTATPTGTQAISAASGAIASGALASGSMVDIGTQADAVCGTSTGTCSLISLIKFLNSTPGAIDQTTPGTTNGVIVVPSSSSAIGITPVVSGSGEASHVLKASAGNAYSVYATNLSATQGFLLLLNATSAPVDGAITPLACSPLAPNGVASINYSPGPPGVFSTGIVAVVSSAATCFTKTTGVITAFISGQVQ